MRTQTMLSPRVDWRVAAEAMKDAPPCANCGEPFGNIYFGAAHFDKFEAPFAECPGYQPEVTRELSRPARPVAVAEGAQPEEASS